MYGKRFLDEVDAFVQDAVVGDDVGRIAGHEQAALEIGVIAQQVLGQVSAVHLRHDDVGSSTRACSKNASRASSSS
jgi:hypothetical protein